MSSVLKSLILTSFHFYINISKVVLLLEVNVLNWILLKASFYIAACQVFIVA